MLRPALYSTLPLLIVAVASCGSGSDAAGSTLNPPGEAADGAGGTDAGSTASTGIGSPSAGSPSTSSLAVGNLNLTSDGSSSTTGGGNGMPEVCDGIDNDGNGIADDVDAGGDGVCDCLNIATLGQIGPWSDGGNIFETWLNARSPLGATALEGELTAEMLAPFNVVVVLHVDTTEVSNDGRVAAAHHVFSDAEAAAFGGWVQAGGGVMTTIGYTNDEAAEVVNVNRLLAAVGLGYSATNLDLTGHVREWDEHPITLGVSNIFTDNGVEPTSAQGTTIARGQANGQPALQVAEVGSGRVVVWGDEWITYDSEWVDVEEQQVELFWLNILKWLSPPMTCQVPIPPEIVK